jgi:hypothetical protein
MIELSRRHGYYDPRWHPGSLSRPRALVLAPKVSNSSIQRWENEGGRYSMGDETGAPAGLEWYAFCSRYFPRRGRHDLEALKAYEACRLSEEKPRSVFEVAAGDEATR